MRPWRNARGRASSQSIRSPGVSRVKMRVRVIDLNPADPDLVVDDGKSPALEVSQAVPHGLKLFG
jgi:hypothetical protein